MGKFIFAKNKKKDCPLCGSNHKKTLSVFVGFEDTDFGKCDRVNNCGYFLQPDSSNNPNEFISAKEDDPIKQAIHLDKDAANQTINIQTSNFHTYCIKILGISSEHLIKWCIGTNQKNDTVFYFKDAQGNYLNKKTGKYKEDGKRSKSTGFYSLKQPKDTLKKYALCLFGEHQLTNDNKNVVVKIVESEKTAVIASWFYPQYIWLACGSASGLSDGRNGTNNKIESLFGRQIHWMCDADFAGRNNSSISNLKKWEQNFKIQDLFNRADGYDIADYIIDNVNKQKSTNPTLDLNIDKVSSNQEILFTTKLINAIEKKTVVHDVYVLQGDLKNHAIINREVGFAICINSLNGSLNKEANISELHPLILDAVEACQITKLYFVVDGYLRTIFWDSFSSNILEARKDLSAKNSIYYYAITKFADACHASKVQAELAYINEVKELPITNFAGKLSRNVNKILAQRPAPKTGKPEELEAEKEIMLQALIDGENNDWFTFQSLAKDYRKSLTRFFLIDDVNDFYTFYNDKLSIGLKEFVFGKSIYAYNPETEEVDPVEYFHAVWEKDNQYFTTGKSGRILVSSFIFRILYHIYDQRTETAQYIVQFNNEEGYEVTLILDTSYFDSAARFSSRTKVLKGANWMWYGTTQDLQNILGRQLKGLRSSTELNYLGYHANIDVYFYSNGAIKGKVFYPVNEFGQISIEGNNYYVEAKNKMNEHIKEIYASQTRINCDLDAEFELGKLIELFSIAYDYKNALLGASFYISSLFARQIYERCGGSYPLLYAFGQKGSGKTTFMQLWTGIFGTPQNVKGLRTGLSIPAIQLALTSFSNIPFNIDEYTNDIDQSMEGYVKAMFNWSDRDVLKQTTNGKRETEYLPQRGPVSITGEFIPTDSAILERTMFCEFQEVLKSEETGKAFIAIETASINGELSAISRDLNFKRDELMAEFNEGYSTLKTFMKTTLAKHKVERAKELDVLLQSEFTRHKLISQFEFMYKDASLAVNERYLKNYSMIGAVIYILLKKSWLSIPFLEPMKPHEQAKTFALIMMKSMYEHFGLSESGSYVTKFFTLLSMMRNTSTATNQMLLCNRDYWIKKDIVAIHLPTAIALYSENYEKKIKDGAPILDKREMKRYLENHYTHIDPNEQEQFAKSGLHTYTPSGMVASHKQARVMLFNNKLLGEIAEELEFFDNSI